MSRINISDILGVFTNGDPDNLKQGQVKTLKNFRPVNGKLVKTHGSADTGKFSSLSDIIPNYTITNVFTFASEHLSGINHRTLIVKIHNQSNRVAFEFNNGF